LGGARGLMATIASSCSFRANCVIFTLCSAQVRRRRVKRPSIVLRSSVWNCWAVWLRAWLMLNGICRRLLVTSFSASRVSTWMFMD
jgi:hypothetical protein